MLIEGFFEGETAVVAVWAYAEMAVFASDAAIADASDEVIKTLRSDFIAIGIAKSGCVKKDCCLMTVAATMGITAIAFAFVKVGVTVPLPESIAGIDVDDAISTSVAVLLLCSRNCNHRPPLNESAAMPAAISSSLHDLCLN